jgi:SAM-dependent methyltransferase
MSSQDHLYERPVVVERTEDCHFYHVMDVPGERLVGGDFDLRGGEDDYLGHIPLDGRRVLEIGPASGFLTFHMESRGASVVAVELGPDAEWDIVPYAELDLEAIREERRQIMERLRNGFWWAYERTGSRAKVHYGDVYALPDELGDFDVAVMAAVLRHTKDPLRIVEGCARHATSVVITEMYFPELDGAPVTRLHPSRESTTWDTWWDFSPEVLVGFLRVLGFDHTVVTFHEQRFLASEPEHSIPFFTLVGSRSQSTEDLRA